jgi:hypothetical protein
MSAPSAVQPVALQPAAVQSAAVQPPAVQLAAVPAGSSNASSRQQQIRTELSLIIASNGSGSSSSSSSASQDQLLASPKPVNSSSSVASEGTAHSTNDENLQVKFRGLMQAGSSSSSRNAAHKDSSSSSSSSGRRLTSSPSLPAQADDDLAYSTLTQLAHMLHTGAVTPQRLLQVYRERLQRWAGAAQGGGPPGGRGTQGGGPGCRAQPEFVNRWEVLKLHAVAVSTP